jgi:uncharacterized protein (TIGR03435 family)
LNLVSWFSVPVVFGSRGFPDRRVLSPSNVVTPPKVPHSQQRIKEGTIDEDGVRSRTMSDGRFPNRRPAVTSGTGWSFVGRTAGGNLQASIVAAAVPITNLVNMLQGQVGRVVVDKTALNGLFDFNMKFTPEGAPSTSQATAPGPPPAAEPPSPLCPKTAIMPPRGSNN